MLNDESARMGKYSTCTSFRSMYMDAEARGAQWAQGDDPRVTPFGRVMRKTRMDEIPQFWNVLKGDMSTVGQRPALPAEVAAYIDYQNQRLLVKPGMTCYWQTHRNRDLIYLRMNGSTLIFGGILQLSGLHMLKHLLKTPTLPGCGARASFVRNGERLRWQSRALFGAGAGRPSGRRPIGDPSGLARIVGNARNMLAAEAHRWLISDCNGKVDHAELHAKCGEK